MAKATHDVLRRTHAHFEIDMEALRRVTLVPLHLGRITATIAATLVLLHLQRGAW